MDTMSNTSFHDGRWFVPPSRGEADCGEENRDVNGGNDDGFQVTRRETLHSRCLLPNHPGRMGSRECTNRERDARRRYSPGKWKRRFKIAGRETESREEGEAPRR